MSPRPLTVVLVCEEFPLAALGCYGHEWIDTTTFDTLAAEGLVGDRVISPWGWTFPRDFGALVTSAGDAPLPSFAGWHLIREAAARPLQISPGMTDEVLPDVVQPAATVEDMAWRRLLRRATAWLRSDQHAVENARGLWLHSTGISAETLPPLDAWDLYADEFADEELDWTDATDERLLGHPALMAATVSLLDVALGEFVQALKGLSLPIRLIFGAWSGVDWPAVTRDPVIPPELTIARLHVPWLLWEYDPTGMEPSWAPRRIAALLEPSDFLRMVEAWGPAGWSTREGLWRALRGEADASRPHIDTPGHEGAWSRITPHDQTIFRSAGPHRSAAVLAHHRLPEDRWNVFNLVGQAPTRVSEVAGLAAAPRS